MLETEREQFLALPRKIQSFIPSPHSTKALVDYHVNRFLWPHIYRLYKVPGNILSDDITAMVKELYVQFPGLDVKAPARHWVDDDAQNNWKRVSL